MVISKLYIYISQGFFSYISQVQSKCLTAWKEGLKFFFNFLIQLKIKVNKYAMPNYFT